MAKTRIPLPPNVVESAALDCHRALAPHQQMPPAEEIADLAARLAEHCARAAKAWEGRSPDTVTSRTATALRDWQCLRTGPGEGPFAAWLHLRAMARTCRTLLGQGQSQALLASLPEEDGRDR
ncbi:DUF6415 family natural product biosynthesis protein [Streptomyces benahoarensis]|uniref:Uncharacterized protein n=1 Tax=Streptomyces benahoarensis TaxID=2595054 RepID=A0A553ZC36_9ACTN|nr:DUF6415 family natural product biosynthesis protein [Streptomyces benahoarensis]TSB14953.1 hypothetical protein FNJ62_29050 [Streptomyces benahoarensis]TSB39002.1 hypothetical protein FNZ23_16350 [Streptomyces benahoarensis]